MQRQRLLSDRQQFQREQMKLLELRSPTTLTPQTPLPLTPSAGVKRQFVVPTPKLAPAPPPTANDAATTTKDTSSTSTGDEGVAKDNAMSVAADDGTVKETAPSTNNPLQDITTELEEGNVPPNIDVSDVLTAVESADGTELLPPVDEDITTTTNAATEELFPIDFPSTDHQSPVNEDHMISEGTEDIAVQQSVEFESSNQMPSDIASPDPTAFDDFDNMAQFDQSDVLPDTDQSDQLDKLAEQLDQLPQQPVPMDDNRHTTDDVHQLDEL